MDSIKYLGITLDSKLKCSKQLETVTNKLSQIAGISYKLGKKFDRTTAKQFYYSFAYSTLTYGITVWGGILNVQNCDAIHRVHKKIMKNLFKQFFPNLSYLAILKKMQILNVTDAYKYCLSELYYKIKYCNIFLGISHEFITHDVPYNIRHINDLNVPFPRVNTLMINYRYYQSSAFTL